MIIYDRNYYALRTDLINNVINRKNGISICDVCVPNDSPFPAYQISSENNKFVFLPVYDFDLRDWSTRVEYFSVIANRFTFQGRAYIPGTDLLSQCKKGFIVPTKMLAEQTDTISRGIRNFMHDMNKRTK